MTHLRTFAIFCGVYEEEGETSLGPLFDSLTFPALTDLVVTGPHAGNISFLRRPVNRSGCTLSSLTFLSDVAWDPSEAESEEEEDVKPQETPIHRAALSLGKELRIPAVGFAGSLLEETKVYRDVKQRWYSLDSS